MQQPYHEPPIIDQPTAANPEPGPLERIKNAILYVVIMLVGSSLGLLFGLIGSVFAAIFTVFAGLAIGTVASRQIARAIALRQRPEMQVVWSQMRRWRYGQQPPPDQR
ncbi:MAG: hypothetical protein Kilf2KO_02750 [Rhodospirillales bacterium]